MMGQDCFSCSRLAHTTMARGQSDADCIPNSGLDDETRQRPRHSSIVHARHYQPNSTSACCLLAGLPAVQGPCLVDAR